MNILVTGGSGFIGINLVDKLRKARHVVLNLDTKAPPIEDHVSSWRKCDILSGERVLELFHEFKPEVVVHLAGRTDTDPANVLDDYRANTEGSENIFRAIASTPSVRRAVITSTQFVHQYKGLPQHDEDFAPHTVYGESKVIMERTLRQAHLQCTWTIIRPTNIWGPWHIRYPFEFWKVLRRGLYFHPGRKPVIRSYGYVGNVVFQVMAIIESPPEKVHEQVFYVGDDAIDIYYWVNGFSIGQVGRPVRVIPRAFVRMLAWTGDLLALLHVRFPLTSSRYRSMTNSNEAPMEKTLRAFGPNPYSLQQGIAETVEWMKTYHPELLKTNR